MTDIVERLRTLAQFAAKASEILAADKTARNRAAGEPTATYNHVTAEQTPEWQAADEIERLRSELADARQEIARWRASLSSGGTR